MLQVWLTTIPLPGIYQVWMVTTPGKLFMHRTVQFTLTETEMHKNGFKQIPLTKTETETKMTVKMRR